LHLNLPILQTLTVHS